MDYQKAIEDARKRIIQREELNKMDELEIARLKLARHFSEFTDLNMSEGVARSVFDKVVNIIKIEDYSAKYTLDKIDLDQEFKLIRERLAKAAAVK